MSSGEVKCNLHRQPYKSHKSPSVCVFWSPCYWSWRALTWAFQFPVNLFSGAIVGCWNKSINKNYVIFCFLVMELLLKLFSLINFWHWLAWRAYSCYLAAASEDSDAYTLLIIHFYCHFPEICFPSCAGLWFSALADDFTWCFESYHPIEWLLSCS